MKRKGWMLLAMVLLLRGTCLAAPEVQAPACILMEAETGTVLYEKEADKQLSPASVTKVMTLLLVLEAVDRGQLSWDQTITASEMAAAKGGSQVYLEPGEQMTLREMVKCVTVASANDCACALAEAVAGGEGAFVELMNNRAKELGMLHTHFANCTGLDDEAGPEAHYSSPRDIAIMSRELLRHDAIREFTGIWMDTIRDGTFGLTNTNKLVRFYPDTTGLKTGFTHGAGYCMSASAKRDGMELIAVVMNCESSTDRFESAKSLLEFGFSGFTLVDPLGEETLPQVNVELGESETVQPVLETEEPMLMDKASAAGITREVYLAESVSAPVEQHQTLGTLTIISGDKVLSELPLVAETAVGRLGWGALLNRMLRRLSMGA